MSASRSLVVWVTENLAVGAAPMSRVHLALLKEQGVDAILNLCAEFSDLHQIEEAYGFEVYYFPVRDEEGPDMAGLEAALAWLDEAVYLGRKVYIHCRHGIGRTGTVLNAYLLRRGLGHRKAAAILKDLRAKPANFEQWWTVRKYGRQSGRLKVREPSVEFRRDLDLAPFFRDYESLAAEAEGAMGARPGESGRCGRDHARCCRQAVTLGLAEAVYLNQAMNRVLSAGQRREVIARAAGSPPAMCVIEPEPDKGGQRPNKGEAALCPLSEQGQCLLFDHRPLVCRTSDLEGEAASALWTGMLGPGLGRLSRELHLALAAHFSPDPEPEFLLKDVVSGRYVPIMFNRLKAAGSG